MIIYNKNNVKIIPSITPSLAVVQRTVLGKEPRKRKKLTPINKEYLKSLGFQLKDVKT